MKKLLLITLIIFSANSIAEDVGLKCDTENANSPKPPATKLLIIEERNKPRRATNQALCRKGGLIVPCKEKVASEFSILEGKWSQDVVIKENPSTYQFYFSNSSYKAFNMRVRHTLNRSDLSMVSHEERCVNGTTSSCSKYQIVSQDTLWQCRKFTGDQIREYAAEQLEDITQDNRVNGQGFNPFQADIETLDLSSLEDFWSPPPPLTEEQEEKLKGNVGVPVFFGTSEKESKNKKKAKKIYNACILDKGSDVDMTVTTIRRAVEETCKEISEDPSFYQSWKYE